MPRFYYQAQNEKGKFTSGTLEARNRDEATFKLKEMGLSPLHLEQEQRRRRFFLKLQPPQTLPNDEKLDLTDNLATMLTCGIPILTAVDALLEDATHPTVKIVLRKIADGLREGKPLYRILAELPLFFDPVYVNIVRAGEEGGNLDVVLQELARGIKSRVALTQKIKSAFLYPTLVIGLLVVVLGFVFSFSLPRIGKVFQGLRIPLPWPTRVLVFLSKVFTQYTFLFIMGFFAMLVLFVLILRSRKVRELTVRYVRHFPYARELLYEIDFAYFTRNLSMLLSSGMPIIDAFELSSDTVVQENIKKAVLGIRDYLVQGKNLADSFREYGRIFPSVIVQIIGTGEESGTLDKALLSLAERYDTRVSDRLRNLAVLLEPILLIIIGVSVGGVLLAILAPIYQMIGQISG